MKTIYFTSHYWKSIRTIRMEYGQVGKKYVLRTYEGEINWEGEKEDLTKEEMFEKEQELLKKVYDQKNVLVGGSWNLGRDLWIFQEKKQSSFQTSFLRIG